MPNGPAYGIRKPLAAVLLAAVVAILCINVALILQNKKLKAEIAAPPGFLPKVGTKVARLDGAALDGSRIQVLFAGQKRETLVFVFSTRCAVCALNWPQWQSIASSAHAQSLRLMYVDIDSPLSSDYVKQHGIDKAVVFAQLDPSYEAALDLRLTPVTILLASDGTVVRVWPGLLSGEQLSDLRQTLGLGS